MRSFKIFLVLIFIIFLSGCAKTVTPSFQKLLEVSFTLSQNITFDDENYYLAIAFNSYSQPTTDLSSWKNFFIFGKGTQYRFYKGKDGNLDEISPFSEELSPDVKNFLLKIPLLELYEDGVEPEILHVNIFYFKIDPQTSEITFYNYLFEDVSLRLLRGAQASYSYSGFIDNLILKFY